MIFPQNRIKRYAIHNLDHHLDQSLFLHSLAQNNTKQCQIFQDQDILLARQIYGRGSDPEGLGERKMHTKAVHVRRDSKEKVSLVLGDGDRGDGGGVGEKNVANQKSSKNIKLKYKNFIELNRYEKTDTQKNIALEHRIQKMRNGKLQPNDIDNKRLHYSLYNNSNTQSQNQNQNQNKDALLYGSQIKKLDGTARRGRRNGNSYVPIGYNGQRLEKKVSKISDLAKYNTHFINMEIAFDSGQVLLGSDGKENIVKKQHMNCSNFQKTFSHKGTELFSSKNVYPAVFRAPPKKVSEEEKKLEFDRKLENFVNNYGNQPVQLTMRELMQFKQIVYKRREEQYFLAQQEVSQHLKPHKQVTQQSTNKNMSSIYTNIIKKQEVNIQSYKNYQQLINISELNKQFINRNSNRKSSFHKRPKPGLDIRNNKRSLSRKPTGHSLLYPKSRTTRREVGHWREPSIDA